MLPTKRLCFLFAILALCGCSSSSIGSVSGTVLVNGQPTGGFDIRYYAVSNGLMAVGGAQADGKYQLVFGRGDRSLPIGEYKVTVTPTADIEGVPMPKVKLSKDLFDASTTPLTKTVGPGENVIDLDLTTM